LLEHTAIQSVSGAAFPVYDPARHETLPIAGVPASIKEIPKP
jgi:hypothetical protein